MDRDLVIAKELPPYIKGMGVDVAMDNLWMETGREIVLPDGTTMHDIRTLEYENQLLMKAWENSENTLELLVDLIRDPDYIHFVCKYFLNIDLLPYQCVIISMFWHKPLPMLIMTRGGGKSYLLAVYIALRCLLHQGCKVCVVGASLRQSMVIFNYVQDIWESAPVLQDICGGRLKAPKRDQHMCYWNCGDSRAIFLPLGDGTKIRGQRANVIIADEFASIPAEIFETVVRGFAAVKSDGLYLNVSKAYKENVLKHLGQSLANEYEDEADHFANKYNPIPTMLNSNQIILTGTAFYQFNHFYKYFQYYRSIITTGGDPEKLKREFPDMEVPLDLDPAQYAIIRVPYDLVPPGMMDATILNQGRATMDPQIFDMEYGACFPSDSEGFYLASWLNACTAPLMHSDPSIGEINYPPKVFGEKGKRYIMGVDPASEEDNFAINIIEENGGWRGVVYQWSTNRKAFEDAKREGFIKDHIVDYNTFIITHIRDLVRRFGIELIVMDTGGGGVSVKEGLRDPDKLLDSNDEIILDLEDEDVEGLAGRHMLLMIEFSNYKWRRESHHALRKDIIDKKIIFPNYDPAHLVIQTYEDGKIGKMFDTVEDCHMEIEQCKQETTLIQHTETPTGQEKWDVPKVVGVDADQVKKLLKRDRFTSLLLANWGCRWIKEEGLDETAPEQFGGVAQQWKTPENHAGPRFAGRGANKMRHLPSFNVGDDGHNTSQSNPNRKIFF